MAVKRFNEALQDEATMWAALKRSHDEQYAEINLERSHAVGRSEGKIEGKIEVARKMLDRGVDRGLIAEVTGLDLDELRRL